MGSCDKGAETKSWTVSSLYTSDIVPSSLGIVPVGREKQKRKK